MIENNFFETRRPNHEVGEPLRFGDLILTKLPKNLNEQTYKHQAFARDLGIKLSNTNLNDPKSVPLTPPQYELMYLLLSAANTGRQLSSKEIYKWMNSSVKKKRSPQYISKLLNELRVKLTQVGSKLEI